MIVYELSQQDSSTPGDSIQFSFQEDLSSQSDQISIVDQLGVIPEPDFGTRSSYDRLYDWIRSLQLILVEATNARDLTDIQTNLQLTQTRMFMSCLNLLHIYLHFDTHQISGIG